MVFCKGKWRSLLISNYTTTLRQNVISSSSIQKPKEKKLKEIIEKQVPSLDYLRQIYWYLWLNVWLSSEGMINVYIHLR